MGPAPLGGELWKEGFLHPGSPSPERSAQTEGSLRASKENAAARGEEKLHRWSWWQPETPVCWCGQEVLELRLSGIRPGERSKIGCAETAWEMECDHN